MAPDGIARELHGPDRPGSDSTADGRGPGTERRGPSVPRGALNGVAGRPELRADALPVPVILSICDRLLGEAGRRGHMFGWLRAPGSAVGEWLVVDAYYPGKRLVVLCRSEPSPHEQLYREAVPAHGLRLLSLSPTELGRDRSAAEQALARMIASLDPPARPAAPSARYPVSKPKPRNATPRKATPRKATPPGPSPPAQPRESALSRIMDSLAGPARTPAPRHRTSGAQADAVMRGARFVAAHRTDGTRKSATTQAPPPIDSRDAAPGSPPTTRSRSHAAGRSVTDERDAVQSRPAALGRAAAPARSPRVSRAAAPAPRPPAPPPRRHAVRGSGQHNLGLDELLGLAVILAAEVYLGVVTVTLGAGLVLVGFGIALDTCSRALGTLAAGRTGSRPWAWGCAIGGTPVVAAFALFRRSGPVSVEPAPLAGLLSVFAAVVLVISLIVWALGS